MHRSILNSSLTSSFSSLRYGGLVAALLAGACGDGSSPPPPPPLGDGQIAELQRRADAMVAAGVPGVTVLVREGDQIVRLSSGVSDRSTGAPMTSATRFRVGSITKTMVSVVVQQLAAEGRLHLTDTVADWFPGAAGASGGATVEQLLRNETGIPDYFEDPRVIEPYLAGDLGYEWQPERLVEIAVERPPAFAPGERYGYSNTNFILAGMIAERASGATFADLVQDRIATPLGLTSTTLPRSPEMAAPFSHGYLVGVADEPLDVTGMSPTHMWTAGAVVSNGDDIATFYRALLDGRLLPVNALASMLAPNAATAPSEYGMGISRRQRDVWGCQTFVGHEGGTAGFLSLAFSTIDNRRQYVILTNSFTLNESVGDATAVQALGSLVEGAGCN